MCRLWKFLGLSILTLSACVPASAGVSPVEVPTPRAVTHADYVYGLWTITSDLGTRTDWYFRPDDDSTYTIYIHRGEQISRISGKYWFEDGKFLIRDDFCLTPGAYTIMLTSNKELIFTPVEDSCDARLKQLSSNPAVWLADKPKEYPSP